MFLTRSGICLWSRVVCDLYCVPEQPVVSYLTPLTGVDEATLAERGTTLEEALTKLRSKLDPNITLVVSSGWGSGLRFPKIPARIRGPRDKISGRTWSGSGCGRAWTSAA